MIHQNGSLAIVNDAQREHIYRTHRLPPQCPRCYLSFESVNEREEHQRSQDGCSLQPRPTNAPVGMNERQETQLRSKTLFRGLTEVAKWTKMYQILFPDEHESMIPTPCEYLIYEYFEHKLSEANSDKIMRISLITQLCRRAYNMACLLSAKFLD